MYQSIVMEVFRARIRSIINTTSHEAASDGGSSSGDKRKLRIEEFHQRMSSKFANCKMTSEELDLYMYEHGLSIERYVMAMFKARGNDVKCQNFYVPVQ